MGMACDARRFVETCRAVQAVKPLSTQHARPNLFPAEAPPQATKLDAVTRRTIRNVPDYDGPRGAEKVQVELRQVPPPPEQPDPLAGVREAVHQMSEPSSFVKTVKSVPDWDGPCGAEKIQVELRRSPATPEASPADHEYPPTEEGEQGALPEGSPVTNGDSGPQPVMRPGPGRCTKCLEFWLSGESHPPAVNATAKPAAKQPSWVRERSALWSKQLQYEPY